MQQFLDSLLQLLQQGIAAIFKFIKLIWSWAGEQISQLMSVPWQSWPVAKQVLLAIIVAGVAWAVIRVLADLWQAGERILAAFATLLGVFVKTLPSVLMAGLIALGGIWVLNKVDLSGVKLPRLAGAEQSQAPAPATERQ